MGNVQKKPEIVKDYFPVTDVAYLELYVGNAKGAAYYFVKAFGFQIIGYAGLETGSRDKTSYVLKQGKTYLVITGSLYSTTAVSNFIHKHGDGVKDIALYVSDVEKAYQEGVKRGAISLSEPKVEKDAAGEIKKAVIATYGDTVHTLIEKQTYNGIFLPGYVKSTWAPSFESVGIIAVDHVVGNVESMNEWVQYYEQVMGFKQLIHFDDDDISTEYSALMSKVMTNGSRIKFPINEPATGKRKSQIQEYLDYNNGPGVQHIALLTNDIIATVEQLHKNGIEFLNTPDSYYEELSSRVGKIDEEIAKLKELKILVDRDDEGYLLQIFTKPIVDRPTLFIEIIQRKGSRGFGEGNFKALFEAIEREQALRGNL